MAKSKGFENNIPWKKFNNIKDKHPIGLLLIFVLQMLQQAASLAARRYPQTAAALLELGEDVTTVQTSYKAEQAEVNSDIVTTQVEPNQEPNRKAGKKNGK